MEEAPSLRRSALPACLPVSLPALRTRTPDAHLKLIKLISTVSFSRSLFLSLNPGLERGECVGGIADKRRSLSPVAGMETRSGLKRLAISRTFAACQAEAEAVYVI